MYPLHSGYRRNRTILSLVPQIGGKRNPNSLQPGTGAPLSQPGVAPRPVGSPKQFVEVSTTGQAKTVAESQPMTATSLESNRKINKTKRMPSTKRGKKKEEKDFMYVPRGGRPKPPEKPGLQYTTKDRVPSGAIPYRDGPPTFTPSFPLGKIGELPNKKQTTVGWDLSAQKLNNIRCSIQVVSAAFFGQVPSFSTGPGKLDNNLDDTQGRIFGTFYNQIRAIYQDRYNLNTQFVKTFTAQNIFTYFHDVHALHVEFVCYLQLAAYYKNVDSGMENILLDNIGIVLNTDVFTVIRNDMSRALRFSYLPQKVIDSNYEMFQTYRMGEQVTAPSFRYVTPAMMNFMKTASVAVDQAAFDAAVTTYKTHVSGLVNHVVTGRPNATSVDPGILRLSRSTTGAGVTTTNYYPMFDIGKGALSQEDIGFLNSVFARVSASTGLASLNNQKEGNSQSHHDVDMCDAFNNHLLAVSTLSVFPSVVSGVSTHVSPDGYNSVVYASERKSEDVLFKATQFQAEKFTGSGHLLYRTDPAGMNRWTRVYLDEVDRNTNLEQSSDLTFQVKNSWAQVGNDTQPLVQDNYVTKVFRNEANTSYLSVNNVDSTSAAKWFITLSDLMEKQYDCGIDLLM
uniref:Uncharacterized protein n=1 Tax=viral metagenome TaxID=1070528 RepID=A0A2V0RC39_9ZZZZ